MMNEPLLSPLIQSVIFAAFVGFVVSLDVIGLIASQWKDFQINSKTSQTLKTPWKQAVSHASMHSALFLIYILFVAYAISYSNILFASIIPYIQKYTPDWQLFYWLKNIVLGKEFLEIAAKSMLFISSIVIIMFVWFTYREKIFEDHSKKEIDPSKSLRIDVKAIYYFVELFVPKYKNLLNLALILAVAVDMLAVSAIIRVRFNSVSGEFGNAIGADTGYKGSHIEFSGSALIDVLIFAAFIFTMVYTLSYIAAKFVSYKSSALTINRIRVFRLSEAIFIFAILFRTLPHLLGGADVSVVVPKFENYFGIIFDSLIFGTIMTFTLVFSKGFGGWDKIGISVGNGLAKDSRRKRPIQSRFLGMPLTQRLKIFGGFVKTLLLPIFVAFLILVLAFLLIAKSVSAEPANQMKYLVEMLYICVAIFTGAFLFLYVPGLARFRLKTLAPLAAYRLTGTSAIDASIILAVNALFRIVNIFTHVLNFSITLLARLGQIEIRLNKKYFKKDWNAINGIMIFMAYWLVIVGMHYIYTGRIEIVLSSNAVPHLQGLFEAGIFPFVVFCLFKYRTLRQVQSKIALGSAARGAHYKEDVGEFLKATAVVCLVWKFGLEYFGS